LGASIIALLFFAIGRIAFAFPILLLAYRFGGALLQTWGLKRNPYMDDIILSKYSAQLPNPDGSFGPKPADDQITVLHIGGRCNQYVSVP
jgi:hypothetical protein